MTDQQMVRYRHSFLCAGPVERGREKKKNGNGQLMNGKINGTNKLAHRPLPWRWPLRRTLYIQVIDIITAEH